MYEGQMPKRLWNEREDDFIWSNAHPSMEHFLNIVKSAATKIKVIPIVTTTVSGDNSDSKSFKELWDNGS